MSMARTMRTGLLSVLLAAGAAAPALAECYDILGCSDRSRFSAHADYLESVASGPNCAFLFTMRNTIYKEHGYCFRSGRARAEFGDAGCSVDDAGALGLSGIERANVAAITRAEASKNCPRS